MTSTRERQRAAARARLERDMAARSAAARKRRQLQTMIGAGAAVVVVAVGVIVLVRSLNDDDSGNNTATPGASALPACVWKPVPKEQRTPTTKDVGTPPTTGEPRSGTRVMTVATSAGDLKVTMNLAKAPCTAASMSFLADKKFYDGTKCHRMFPGMLQCGDPSAKGKGYRQSDGTGGPTYRFAHENLPVDEKPEYPAGVVAMANSGQPETNGSQFFFIYQDVQLKPDYTVIGKLTKESLAALTKATAKGHDGAFDPNPGGGHPKTEILIKSVTVGAPES